MGLWGLSEAQGEGVRATRRGRRRRLFAVMFWVLTIAWVGDASAQARDVSVPSTLRDWVDWVLHDAPPIECPQVAGARHCVWPGELQVSADATGATFELSVWLAREGEVPLPGSRDYWPQNVTSNGANVLVGKSGEAPVVKLSRGMHRIWGRFQWTALPEVLPVPAQVGRIELEADGKRILHPRVDTEGRLWLSRSGESGTASENDTLRVSVYRRLSDGVPLRVETRLSLHVSGRAREVELGRILLDASHPTRIETPLPVRIASDGVVTAYVRPGTHNVTIEAVVSPPPDSVRVPRPPAEFFDPQEVWVWIPNEDVRSVNLKGLPTVDPERTSLPSDWHGETTFLAEPGKELLIETTRRGLSEPAPNRLTLRRELWLDLDGTGYTVRDHLSGTLNQGWRLDYGEGEGAMLGRVTDTTNEEDLLITTDSASGLTGVELRNSQPSLRAELRLEQARSKLMAVGWQHDVQGLDTTLHLPPGWTLLGGTGVDRMPGTWVESWNLWNFFFVLMVALAVGRLFGWQWAPPTALALCLSHGYGDAPQWIWIQLIVTLALLRVLPHGLWRRGVLVYRAATLLVLVAIFVPFAHDQIQEAIHPQIAVAPSGHHDPSFTPGAASPDQALRAEAAPMDRAMEMKVELPSRYQIEEEVGDSIVASESLSPARKPGYVKLQQVDPNAVVQTGPGLPDWSWRSYRLEWSGPVGKDHTIRLWILSPWMNSLLAIVRVLLLLGLALILLAPRDMTWGQKPGPVPGWWRMLFGSGAALVAAALVLGVAARPAAAEPVDTPSKQTLDELRSRLVTAAKCPDPCVVVSRADISIDDVQFEMRAEVHAARQTGWHLPGPPELLRIDSVSVDQEPTNQLRREPGGLTVVRLPRGRHEVVLRGTLAARNVVTLQFDDATRPQFVTFDSGEWSCDGIGPTGVPDGSLQLTRKIDARDDAGKAAASAQELPPWFSVQRHLALGVPWQIRTTVTRHDASRPQLVKIGLLDGEKVITDKVRMEGQRALVDFSRGQTVVEYTSEFPVRESFALVAPTDEPWTETWTIECSRIWRCNFSDLPAVSHVVDEVFRPTWQPWPGEKLEVQVQRPEGAPGSSSTVSRVDYEVHPGKRLMQATLRLEVRASQGGWQEVTLPEGAELQTVQIDGEAKNIRPKESVVNLPIRPGSQTVELNWQQPWERSFVERMPKVELGAPAANVRTTIHRGEDRWLLGAYGPAWGPAVTFWPRLFLLALLALLLGTIRGLPLAMHEWLLLAIGMSQLPVLAMLPVVVWFVVLARRRTTQPSTWWRFDLLQLFIVFLTLGATIALYAAIHTNLLIDVDMQVRGAGSTNWMLRWYTDRVDGALPTPYIVSLPLLVYRLVMLLWAFWLVSRLIQWAKWGWKNFADGGIWQSPPPRAFQAPTRKMKPPATDGSVDAKQSGAGDEEDSDEATEQEEKLVSPSDETMRDHQAVRRALELAQEPEDEEERELESEDADIEDEPPKVEGDTPEAETPDAENEPPDSDDPSAGG